LTAELIDGKSIAAQVRAEIKERVAKAGVVPGFCDILVGDDPASAKYVQMKNKAAESIGGRAFERHLPADATVDDLFKVVEELNQDADVHGFMLQLPIPKHLDSDLAIDRIDPRKDVDGLHPLNLGRLAMGMDGFAPATAAGVMELLQRIGYQTAGVRAVVVGRSNILGRPLSILLSRKDANATVTLCHTGTKDLAEVTRGADLLVAAVGKAGVITGDMIKPGATVIDVGTNPGPDGGLVGDCDFESCAKVAGQITPVPGGVGPMTVAMLLHNTAVAAGA
jgi:methylenetetrahydrofolate dehydrogenase (NADP+) / methenyltetrahydrofolate cyclohydrolase